MAQRKDFRRPDMARDIDSMMRDMDRLFDSVFTSKGSGPAMDVVRTKDEYRLALDVAGYKAEDLGAYIEDHVLHVKGEAHSQDEEGRRYIVRERRHGGFERSVTLPEDADEERMSAGLKDGLLTLVLPRRAKAEPRRIEVGLGK